jgi:hypothetical protein
VFGTEDQSVRLEVFDGNLFTLNYWDRQLQSVAYNEMGAKSKKDEDEQKAKLSKGL